MKNLYFQRCQHNNKHFCLKFLFLFIVWNRFVFSKWDYFRLHYVKGRARDKASKMLCWSVTFIENKLELEASNALRLRCLTTWPTKSGFCLRQILLHNYLDVDLYVCRCRYAGTENPPLIQWFKWFILSKLSSKLIFYS